MKTLLRIDASLRTEGSHSRNLADFFETHWEKANPGGRVIHRDLTRINIPHLQNETVQAFHIPEENYTQQNREAIALSDALIQELKSADQILISSPLYNLNVPSALKSYLDHVVRSGHTFMVDNDGNYQGLLKKKEVFIITAKGEVYKNTVMEALDFQEPYLTTIFGFMGIKQRAIFSLEGTAHPNILQENLNRQKEQILEILKTR